jgi:hypothetical protein
VERGHSSDDAGTAWKTAHDMRGHPDIAFLLVGLVCCFTHVHEHQHRRTIMDLDYSNTANVSQQNDEFDIDLRLEAGSDPGENPSLTTLCTNSSTCSHTSPKLCC